MSEHIQVRENVFTTTERLAIIKENKWEHLFDMAQEIDNKVNLINELTLSKTSKYTQKLNDAMNQAQKEQWYNETLITLTQINQALFGVVTVLNEKVK